MIKNVIINRIELKYFLFFLNKYNVKRNQIVKKGDIIGFVGNTGRSQAPHLHYEVIKDGKRVNPINFYYGNLTPEEFEEGHIGGAKNINVKSEAFVTEIKKFSNYDNLTRYETFEGEHPIDPSGKSFVIQTFFETQAREIVELQCADFDSSVQKNGDNEDYYGIYIFTEEVEDWFAGY